MKPATGTTITWVSTLSVRLGLPIILTVSLSQGIVVFHHEHSLYHDHLAHHMH